MNSGMKHNLISAARMQSIAVILLFLLYPTYSFGNALGSDIANIASAFTTATIAASTMGTAAIQADEAKFEARENSTTAKVTTAINAAEKAHESDNKLYGGIVDALTKLRMESKHDDTEIEKNRLTTGAQNYATALHYQSESEKTAYEYKYKFEELALQDRKRRDEKYLKELELKASQVKDGFSTGLTRVGEALGITKIFNPQPANASSIEMASVGGGTGLGAKGLKLGAGLSGSPIKGKSGNEVRSLSQSFASIFGAGPASGSTPTNHKRSDLEKFQQSVERNQPRGPVATTGAPHQSRASRGLAQELPPSTHR